MADELKPTAVLRLTKPEDQNRIQGERYRRIYANNMTVEFSSWDTSLIFGEIMEAKGEVHTVEEIVHVTMSHSFLKAVLDVITKNVAAFEAQFGEIQAPLLNVILEAAKTETDSPTAPVQATPSTKTETK